MSQDLGELSNLSWINWNGKQQATLARRFRPHTREQLVAIVQAALADGATVRALGSSWSDSDVAIPTIVGPQPPAGASGYLVETSALNDVLDVNFQAGVSSSERLYHVQAGIQLYDLLTRPSTGLNAQGFALLTMGGNSGQTLAGAIATGTHGGDVALRPIADMVRAIELVGPDGTTYWIEKASARVSDLQTLLGKLPYLDPANVVYDDDWFHATLVSMGAFGIVHSMVIAVVPSYKLSETTYQSTWSRVRPLLADRSLFKNELFPDGGRYLQIVLPPNFAESDKPVPFTPNTKGDRTCAVTRRRDEPLSAADIAVGSGGSEMAADLLKIFREYLLAATFGGTSMQEMAVELGQWAMANPKAAATDQAAVFREVSECGKRHNMYWVLPELNKLSIPLLQKSQKRLGVSYVIMGAGDPNASPPPLVDSVELCFDASDNGYLDQIDALLDDIQANGVYGGYVSLRFTAGTTAFLGMQQNQTLNCSVEVTLLAGLEGNDRLMQTIQQWACDPRRAGVRLHWGQRSETVTAIDVGRMYPDLQRWREVRLALTHDGAWTSFDTEFTARCGLSTTRRPPLYRLWNAATGDHFYTIWESERDALTRGGYVLERVECAVLNPNDREGAPFYRVSFQGRHFYVMAAADRDAHVNGGGVYQGVACNLLTAPAPGTVPLYRFHNAAVNDYFYTTDESAHATPPSGYTFEGIAGYAFPYTAVDTRPVSPDGQQIALFRLWNAGANGDHFYTTSLADRDRAIEAGYTLERVECAVPTFTGYGATPFYRVLAKNGHHFYTTDASDRNALVAAGATDEGIACSVLAANYEGTLPLYRFYNQTLGDYLYSIDTNNLTTPPSGYVKEGIAGYVYPRTWQLVPDTPAVVTVPDASRRVMVFCRSFDGRLWVHSLDETQQVWSWTNVGTPPLSYLAGAVGACSRVEKTVVHVDVLGRNANGHLMRASLDANGWAWEDENVPTPLSSWEAPSVTEHPDPGSAAAPWRRYAFFVGAGDTLQTSYGAKQWANQGPPPASVVLKAPAAISYVEGPVDKICVFVTGAQGHLYIDYWNGATWAWNDLGPPPGTTAAGSPAAITMIENGVRRTYAFVCGANGRLYCNFWDGTAGHWSDQGILDIAKVVGTPGAVYVAPARNPTGAGRIYVAVRSDKGELLLNSWDGSNWAWSNLGSPPGSTAVSGVGAAAFATVASARVDGPDEVHFFVIDGAGNLAVVSKDGANWSWSHRERSSV
jgi:hypothetical protein